MNNITLTHIEINQILENNYELLKKEEITKDAYKLLCSKYGFTKGDNCFAFPDYWLQFFDDLARKLNIELNEDDWSDILLTWQNK